MATSGTWNCIIVTVVKQHSAKSKSTLSLSSLNIFPVPKLMVIPGNIEQRPQPWCTGGDGTDEGRNKKHVMLQLIQEKSFSHLHFSLVHIIKQ